MILCSPSCGIAPNSRSGGEVLERELVTALRRGGDDPHVLLARHQHAPANVAVERLRWGRGLRWWLMPYVMGPAIMRCWQRHRFDTLRAHSALFLGPACEWVSRRLGVPWVAHIQHVDRPHPVEGWALRKAARVVTISEFSKRQVLETYGVAPEKIEVIPPGVNHALFTPRPPRRPGRNILFVGGLKARKRPLMLLDILRWGLADAYLTVVGDGPLREAFLRGVSARGLGSRVTLQTNVADRDRVRFYHAADVLLFPSALEGFGMPVLEAMACGLPVVASRHGALPELLPEQWTVGSDYAPDYSARLALLLGRPELAHRIAQHNYVRSLAYSWDRCAQDVRRVCEETRAS